MKFSSSRFIARSSSRDSLVWIDRISIGVILLSLAGASFYFLWQRAGLHREIAAIRLRHESEDRAILESKAEHVQGLLREIYEGGRAIAMLPDVRNIEGKNKTPGARMGGARERQSSQAEKTVRELYDVFSAGTRVSEIYCVLKGFHPDLTGNGTKGERPFFEVVGEEPRPGAAAEDEDNAYESEEYAWLAKEVRRMEAVAQGSRLSPTLSPELVTCGDHDGADHTSADSRRGFILAVPFYHHASGRFSGVIAMIFQKSAWEKILAGSSTNGLSGRFLLVRSDTGMRISDASEPAMKAEMERTPLQSPALIRLALEERGFPGWDLYYRWDEADLQWDIGGQTAAFYRRSETVVLLVGALIVLTLLGRRILRTNGALRLRVRELKEAHQRIGEQNALLDEAQDAIFMFGLDFRVQLWNRAAERFYGFAAADARGRDAREVLFSRAAGVVPTMEDILAAGKWVGELIYKVAEGKALTVESHWLVLHDEQGKPKAIFVVDSNMTEKKSFEAQLRRAQRMENVGALASGVAHDLNNALTPVIVGMQLLEETRDEEGRRGLQQTILSSALRGTAMVKQILGFVRGTQGVDGEVQIRHLIEEMVKIVRDTFPKTITIESRMGKDLWPICGNVTELHQVLLNLCVNARDAMMPGGGRLMLSAENVTLDAKEVEGREGVVPGKFLVLAVADSGSGIPAHVLPKIFEPLFTTKDPDKGTGLGLSTVAGIVRRMGGFISVESTIGIGTKFLIHLPALISSEKKEMEEKLERGELPVGGGEKILLVDDDNTVRRLSKVMLENYGYRVVTATNGLEAVSLFSHQMETIDLVISDVDMPYMDGIDVAAALHLKKASVPIVLISGSELTKEQLAGIDRESLGFLIKPYTVEGLIREVARHTGAVAPRG
ncbi:PAS domain S-box-containing protein [Verrucomicrobium sp. GAS474]|uniref:hybrid sensor histidine kinase/response regulator n=1 Tax=Verrucomicrobium sp. GAS474 TaxID=1882831 RepID=UPI00087DDC8A|nr:PAS domain-containing sensor histidine kinase [Verrucomicrobium sp. GAS474]SDT86751.1 PAS domain S-box-containing protein [Verrucomicrobium sp. GAS474]